jgi:DNA polymerase-3 subunit gamma/tau
LPAWHSLLEDLGLSGSAYNVASNCELRDVSGDRWELLLEASQANLFNERHSALLSAALTRRLGRPVDVHIEIGATQGETPSRRRQRLLEERRRAAQAEIETDPRLRCLLDEFDATLVTGSLMLEEPPLGGGGEG